MTDLGAARAALTTLRQQRDAALSDVRYGIFGHLGKDCSPCDARIDTLLALHAQVVTLENAEKLEKEAVEPGIDYDDRVASAYGEGRYEGVMSSAAVLRATVEGA